MVVSCHVFSTGAIPLLSFELSVKWLLILIEVIV